jgi:hypothetical protein
VRGLPGWVLVIAVGACAGDVARTLGPTDLEVDGAWLFGERLAEVNGGVPCSRVGRMTLAQDGPRFSGTGVRSGPCLDVMAAGGPGLRPFDVTAGTIDGAEVSLHIGHCVYTGTAYGTAPDSVVGGARCRFDLAGRAVVLWGPWIIARPPDRVAPTVSGSAYGGGANGTLESGDDTLYVRVHARDDRALRALGFQISTPNHQVVRRDSVLVSGRVAEDTLLFALPLDLALPFPPGTPFEAIVFARDTAGNVGAAALDPVLVLPPTWPTVTGALAGATGELIGALRDTLQVTVTATSPRPLTYLGYRLTNFVGQGDSVATAAVSGTHVFRIPVPFAWKGVLLTVEIFARDRLGLFDREGLGSVRVVVFASRPTQVFRVGEGVSDLVYDARRNRLYLGTAVDSGPTTGNPEIRIFQLSPAGFLPSVPLPWVAGGLDLSPGGDSLLVVLGNGRLGVVDLTTRTVDSTGPIAFTPATGRWPYWVRAAANGKAMVTISATNWMGGAGSPGQLVSFDLGTGVQTIRTDAGAAGDIGLSAMLTRTADRQRLLLIPSKPSSSEGQLYDSGTDQFGPSVPILWPTVGGAPASADRSGTLWLVGNNLLGADLVSRRLLGSTQVLAVASALIEDGTLAYVAVPEGVARFRTSDGAELERILLPDPPRLLLVTPDGSTLLALAPQGLLVVDLR